MALYPLDKRFHPDFAQIGRKPVGPVEIDRSNPLARGLRLVYLGSRDFIGDTKKPVTGNYTIEGEFAHVDEANSIDLDHDFSGATGLTVYTLQRYNGGSAFGAYVGTELSFNNSIFHGRDSSNKVQSFVGSIVARAAVNSVTTGVFHRTGFVYKASTSIQCFVDGSPSGSEQTTSVPASVPNFSTMQIGEAGTLGADIDTKYVFAWDRNLSDDELALFDRDPYQVLKPAIPMMYFVGGDAPPVGVQPTYFYNSLLAGPS